MAYVLIKNGIVVQKQVNPDDAAGFVQVNDSIVCGMVTTDGITFTNPTPTQFPLNVQAQAELDIVTGYRGTIIRCVAAGVAVPTSWAAYVAALRAIANGTDTTSTALPTRPAYPAGT